MKSVNIVALLIITIKLTTMEDCIKCRQTIENCECHIPDKEKHEGLHKLCKDLLPATKETCICGGTIGIDGCEDCGFDASEVDIY